MIKTNTQLPALLDEKEAAHYLGTTANSLKGSRHTGELFKGVPAPPHVRCGKAIRYSIKALDQWLEKLPQFQNNAEARMNGYDVQCNAKNPRQPP